MTYPSLQSEISYERPKVVGIDDKPISVAVDNPLYPRRLQAIMGRKRGKLPKLDMVGNVGLLAMPSIGISGSRDPSENGLNIARDCAEQAAKEGIVIVSGYARGVDIEAHYYSLRAGGKTIIVLPEGMGHFRQSPLADVWELENILVMSQFEWSAIWQADRAMKRNDVIIGLSHAVIVVEAGEKGGTLDAGEKVLKKKGASSLFVAQYQNMPERADGNGILLGQGAQQLTMDENGHVDMTKIFEHVKRDDLHKNAEQDDFFRQQVG
ncbi:MAG: DNA-processing protein DprA [Alphaproteobacteria bacterium GM202ARS2]|nr:DNA-processing protein DprA [Alphaproteobacteria bacterium GM202ARS2]